MTTPPRFVVITFSSLRVFEGRKFLAEYAVLGEIDAFDVEAVRLADNPMQFNQGKTP